MIRLLVLNIICSALTVPLIHLDFEIRQDYIAEVLCINRDKPITVCGGKCYLNTQVEKALDQNEDEPMAGNQLVEISFFSQEVGSLSFHSQVQLIANNYLSCTKHFSSSYLAEVFKPPQIS